MGAEAGTPAKRQALTVLQHFGVVVGELVHQAAAGVQLPKSQLVVVLVIQHIDEVGVERVHIL